MIKKYRKRPVIIEAIQYRNNIKDIVNFCEGTAVMTSPTEMYIETLEGPMRVSEKDYVIKGIAGEFYPCNPDIFRQSYEETH